MRPLALLAVGAFARAVVAGCGGSGKSPKLSHDGYAAAALLAGLAAKQLSEARSEAPAQVRAAYALQAVIARFLALSPSECQENP